MFIAVLFVIATNWKKKKKLKCPSVREWLNQRNNVQQ